MEHREQVAHHEAAHAVVALYLGMGVCGGIDLDAVTSMEGAFGNAAVNLFVADPSLPLEDQRLDLIRNLAVICAGAASDAKVKGETLENALEAQLGDRAVAIDHARAHPIVGSDEEAEHVVMKLGLPHAGTLVGKASVWDAIVRVAEAALSAGGKLDAAEVTALGSSR